MNEWPVLAITGIPSALVLTEARIKETGTIYSTFGKVRMLGSAALSLAYVAAGRSDSYWEPQIALWDVAAGLALVTAAGGLVEFSDIDLIMVSVFY